MLFLTVFGGCKKQSSRIRSGDESEGAVRESDAVPACVARQPRRTGRVAIGGRSRACGLDVVIAHKGAHERCLGRSLAPSASRIVISARSKSRVFNSQPHGPHQPKSGTVKQACNQMVRAAQTNQYRFNFAAGKHDRKLFRRLCALDVVYIWQVLFEPR
jgi:hypothetical protein